jgi:hypothetical protein
LQHFQRNVFVGFLSRKKQLTEPRCAQPRFVSIKVGSRFRIQTFNE